MTDKEQEKDGFALMLDEASKDKDNPEKAMKWAIEIIKSYSDFARWVNGFAYSTNEKILDIEGHLALLDTQIDEVMNDGLTSILPEHAEKFLKLIEAFKWMITEALKNDQSTEGQTKLNELTVLAEECDSIVQEGIMEDDEDEDEPEADTTGQ